MFKMNNQSGAVSLFVVVFSSLLITVIVIGFVRVMLQDQRQATMSDLSQSAYDSALAGVEDAKRALSNYYDACADNPGTASCIETARLINSDTCNSAIAGTLSDVEFNSNEVKIQQPGKTNSLDQAYTCVKVSMNTPDYLGSLSAHDIKTIPLRTVGGSPIRSVKIEWFSLADVSSGSESSTAVNLYGGDPSDLSLPAQNTWPANRPAMLRVQLVQFSESAGFRLTDFDESNGSQSNTNTLFLYPTSSAPGGPVSIVNRDIRRASAPASSKPHGVRCINDLSAGGYACSVDINLPDPIGGGDRVAFLNLGAIYNRTSYRVTMYNGSTAVQFGSVQPEVDSTGRASDLFRRVRSRVEMNHMSFSPSAAVDITGSFCKSFQVADSVDHYRQIDQCDPRP